MWKIRHGLCPNDLQISFSESNGRSGPLAIIPSLVRSSRAAHQTLYDNSFAVVGPKLWNILPASIKNEDTIHSFKAAVYTFCSSFPDNPPVIGYTPQNRNSLLDWASSRSFAPGWTAYSVMTYWILQKAVRGGAGCASEASELENLMKSIIL